MTVSLFEDLLEAGKDLNLKVGGYYAIDSLRIEKGYRAWGAELSTDTTPLEAGLSFAVDFTKDFNGKQALLKQKSEGLKRRLVSFTVDDNSDQDLATMWGDEAILRNGKVVGFVSSASYGFALGKTVCMGFVTNKEDSHGLVDAKFISSGKYQMEVAGKLYNATPSLKPLYDPTNSKVNCQAFESAKMKHVYCVCVFVCVLNQLIKLNKLVILKEWIQIFSPHQ